MSTPARIDHLVVLADSLESGVAWCEATLGVVPGPGGKHPLMGTHNRLLRIATPQQPRAYLEIIAIDPATTPQRARRWFDMDHAQVREAVRTGGPRLAHVVAEVPDVEAAVAALRGQGIERGDAIAASRETPRGLLQWRITVRDDGQRLFNGCLPTLIQWGDVHPAAGMEASGLALQSLSVAHPDSAALRAACQAIGLDVVVTEGPPCLRAVLDTPRGRVTLESEGL
ncbi:VOC family protein [Ramlibacter sp.]|uniref:VOC family protein n=1 Tax=Ramlibacter sp. TaxID=1917967 RepID=UPI0025FD6DB6|nr:VOC family protein [Ramlibacter sp.]